MAGMLTAQSLARGILFLAVPEKQTLNFSWRQPIAIRS